MWERCRRRAKEANGALDGKIVGSLEGLFRVWDHVKRKHEVARVSLLSVRGSSKPCGKEGMVHIECRSARRRIHIVRIADIEGMAYLIGVKQDSVWLVNNRIDLNTWNEVYY